MSGVVEVAGQDATSGVAELVKVTSSALHVRVEGEASTSDPHAASAWTATATADNALATATKAAGGAGVSHYVTGLQASFSAAAAGKLATLKEGASILASFYVHNDLQVTFPKAIKIAANTAVSVELAASGTLGVIGAVNLQGYSI